MDEPIICQCRSILSSSQALIDHLKKCSTLRAHAGRHVMLQYPGLVALELAMDQALSLDYEWLIDIAGVGRRLPRIVKVGHNYVNVVASANHIPSRFQDVERALSPDAAWPGHVLSRQRRAAFERMVKQPDAGRALATLLASIDPDERASAVLLFANGGLF